MSGRHEKSRRCERCGRDVDVSEAENETDVAALLLAHLALDCPGTTQLRAPDPGLNAPDELRLREAAASAELSGADMREWAGLPDAPGADGGFFQSWDLVSVGGVILRTHHERMCRPPCALHAPSGHHMREWQQAWSQPLLAIFRRCPHGHFHPDPDDLQARTGALLHTCDGCCLAPRA